MVGNVLVCLLLAALKGLFSPCLAYVHIFKSSLSIRRQAEMPCVVRFYGCDRHRGTAVAAWLPEQGVRADSVLGWGPTCADSHGKDREHWTVLAGQERALASSGWALDLGGQWTRAARGNAVLSCTRPKLSLRVFPTKTREWRLFSF